VEGERGERRSPTFFTLSKIIARLHFLLQFLGLLEFPDVSPLHFLGLHHCFLPTLLAYFVIAPGIAEVIRTFPPLIDQNLLGRSWIDEAILLTRSWVDELNLVYVAKT